MQNTHTYAPAYTPHPSPLRTHTLVDNFKIPQYKKYIKDYFKILHIKQDS